MHSFTRAAADELRNSWQIDRSEIVFLERIGAGSYGEVFRGQWRTFLVAIKVYSGLAEDMPRQQAHLIKQEIEFVRTLRDPNVVLFLGAGVLEVDQPFLVMELVEGGSLGAMLAGPSSLPWLRRIKLMTGAARGMVYLHDKQRIHRDLNSNNLLVRDDTLLVADFGISCFAPNARRPLHSPRLRMGNTSGMGTPLWMAPEMLAAQPYSFPADVYSYAVVMWEMAARRLPAWELVVQRDPEEDPEAFLSDLTAQLFLDERLPIDSSWPSAYSRLMCECWRTITKDRPLFVQIVDRLIAIHAEMSHELAISDVHLTAPSSDRSDTDDYDF
jgi:serine/threonine protein kinase